MVYQKRLGTQNARLHDRESRIASDKAAKSKHGTSTSCKRDKIHGSDMQRCKLKNMIRDVVIFQIRMKREWSETLY